jgi:hypothetical protein
MRSPEQTHLALTSTIEPTCFEEAIKDEFWNKAMDEISLENKRDIILSQVYGEKIDACNLYIVAFVVLWNIILLDTNTSFFSLMILQE